MLYLSHVHVQSLWVVVVVVGEGGPVVHNPHIYWSFGNGYYIWLNGHHWKYICGVVQGYGFVRTSRKK